MTIRIFSKGDFIKERIRNVRVVKCVLLNGIIIIEYSYFYDMKTKYGYKLQPDEYFQVVNDYK